MTERGWVLFQYLASIYSNTYIVTNATADWNPEDKGEENDCSYNIGLHKLNWNKQHKIMHNMSNVLGKGIGTAWNSFGAMSLWNRTSKNYSAYFKAQSTFVIQIF